MVTTRWDFLNKQLELLGEQNMLRSPDAGLVREACAERANALGLPMLDVSSNDYLGYAHSPVSRETTAVYVGAGASRLIHGTQPVHAQLEAELSDWLSRDACLLFSSGYAANVGVLSALPQAGDLIISDALNHASIVDGCRLSRAEVRVVDHLNLDKISADLEREARRRRCWVATESYFSMDGDTPNLARLREICDAHGALLIVDEAHALGVFGPEGKGLCNQFGIEPDILIGTFGKSVGGQGAFVAADIPVRNWLWNKARSFVYSTATSPVLAHHILCNVRRLRADDSGRAKLTDSAALARRELQSAKVHVLAGSHGPIIPVILGDAERALIASEELCRHGILAQAIRPPTVAPGLARIRLTIQASFTSAELSRIIRAVVETCAQ